MDGKWRIALTEALWLLHHCSQHQAPCSTAPVASDHNTAASPRWHSFPRWSLATASVPPLLPTAPAIHTTSIPANFPFFHPGMCWYNDAFLMVTCSLGRCVSRLTSGARPPASLMPLRLESLPAMLASVLAAISVTLDSGPESSNVTSRCRPPHSRMELKNCSVVLRFPMTAAALSVIVCRKFKSRDQTLHG